MKTATTVTISDNEQLAVQRITTDDLKEVLRKGLDDFNARPTHVIFLCVIYPVIALVLGYVVFGYNLLPLVFPLISGFALVGPLAATGLYELSRRREEGRDYNWWHVFDVVKAPSRRALAFLGLVMAAIFVAWLQTALMIYGAFFSGATWDSFGAFAAAVLTTPAGWGLIVVGCGIGFLFAAVVFMISVVSLPMLLDRKISAGTAVRTSINAVAANPKPMATWALIVVAALVAGSIPLFVGLAIVMPVLGHSTWHLYRKLVTY